MDFKVDITDCSRDDVHLNDVHLSSKPFEIRQFVSQRQRPVDASRFAPSLLKTTDGSSWIVSHEYSCPMFILIGLYDIAMWLPTSLHYRLALLAAIAVIARGYFFVRWVSSYR